MLRQAQHDRGVVTLSSTKGDLPLILSFLLVFMPEQGSPLGSDSDGQQVLNKVRTALLDPAGHELKIRWEYASREETWVGDGVLKMLGEDYLKLTFPDQEILVKESTVMAWYRDTDQVIVDSFDRRDPTNVFSLFLSGFDYFRPVASTPVSDTTTAVVLKGQNPGAYQTITLVVDNRTWIPRVIEVAGGDDMKMTIQVARLGPLADPQTLLNDTLTGSDWVDLRQ